MGQYRPERDVLLCKTMCGFAGDTFEIRKAHYWVRSCETSLGNVDSQDALMRIVANGREKDYGIVMSGYPYNGLVDWNIVNFGPSIFLQKEMR